MFPVGPDQFKGVSSGKDGNGKPPIFVMSMNGDHLYTGGTLQLYTKKLKDRITPQVNFFQQATKERQRRHGVSKKEKRDGEGLVWSKLCVDEYV